MPPSATHLDLSTPDNHKHLKRIEGHNHARAVNWSCFRNRPFLKSDRACQWLIDSIERARGIHDFHIWAWCIMPTHVHVLIFPNPAPLGGTDMAHICKSIKQSVALKAISWTNKHAPAGIRLFRDDQPSGSTTLRFWQRGGGYDRNLWTDRAIWSEIDYIHNNPVADNLCKRATDWPWSSASYFAPATQGPLPLNHTHLPGRP